jgi:hypothetical protein
VYKAGKDHSFLDMSEEKNPLTICPSCAHTSGRGDDVLQLLLLQDWSTTQAAPVAAAAAFSLSKS